MILSYLGSKSSLLPRLKHILTPIIESCGGSKSCVFGDLFGGTCIISKEIHSMVKRVVTCDMELYSYVLGKSLLTTVYTKRLEKIICYMNEHLPRNTKGLVWKHFTPHSPPQFSKMFFTCENGMAIDSMRVYISHMYKQKQISYKEFLFLLGSLLASASRYSNTSGTFRAFLKRFSPRSLQRFVLKPVHMTRRIIGKHYMIKNDAIRVARSCKFDVVYLDPPYNNSHYGAYYSFLNYLCLYNPSVKLVGTGIIESYNKSDFGLSKKAVWAFRNLLNAIQSKYIVLSYNMNAVVETKHLVQLLLKKGNVTLYKMKYKKYKSNHKTFDSHVTELVFVVDCSTHQGVTTLREVWVNT